MKLKTLLKITLILCALLSVLIYSSPVTEGIKRGLILGISVVVPSLFPFTVFSLILFELISATKAKFFVKYHTLFIYVMSLLGGFPVGAKLIEESHIKGLYSRSNALTMLSFCVNAAPSYVITAVGTLVFGSVKIGIILYAASILSSTVIFLTNIRKLPKVSCKDRTNIKTFSEIIVESTANATSSMLGIVAFIALFSGISGIIVAILGQNETFKPFLSLLEITSGIFNNKNVYLVAFLIGFSGVCVHFQIMSICKTIKPTYCTFLFSRILQGGLCTAVTYLLLKIFPIKIETLNLHQAEIKISSVSVTFSIFFVICLIFFMLSLFPKNKIV